MGPASGPGLATRRAPSHTPPPCACALAQIFITGFPPDMRERELHNLCRFLPGYEASQVRSVGGAWWGTAG